jgi:hypothetical protein
MLKKLEELTRWAKILVNLKKCGTASYPIDSNRHRRCLAESHTLNGSSIPHLTSVESLRYRGTTVESSQVGIHSGFEELLPRSGSEGMPGWSGPREISHI